MKDLKKSKVTISNIYHYLQGTIRYNLYYSSLGFLIPKNLEEQIEARIHTMDRDCYNSGQCKMCGCNTTQLQFANKQCDKPCYPQIVSKKHWDLVKKHDVKIKDIKNNVWKYNQTLNLFELASDHLKDIKNLKS